MPVTVAMYEKSYDHIGKRLDALGLDIEVCTFGKDGLYDVGGGKVSPADMSLDYMWLTSHLNLDNYRDKAFELCLATRSIKVLQTFNAGLDHPFYKKLSDKGTRICNSSAQGVAIAEYSIGQVMAVLQPIELQRELQRHKEWKITPFREISQTRWLIVGFGPIGQEIAKRVKAFGAAVDVVRRTPQDSPHVDRMGRTADLPAFTREADVIVIACPLSAETRGMVDAHFFSNVKQGAILVNIARGGLVDDSALIAALDSGRLSTAILDVFHQEPLPLDNPFWEHPKVRLTSHTSFSGNGSRGRWDQLFLDNLPRFVKGEPLLFEVNPKDIV